MCALLCLVTMHLVNDNKSLPEVIFAIANIFPYLFYFGCCVAYVSFSPVAFPQFPVITVIRFVDIAIIYWLKIFAMEIHIVGVNVLW